MADNREEFDDCIESIYKLIPKDPSKLGKELLKHIEQWTYGKLILVRQVCTFLSKSTYILCLQNFGTLGRNFCRKFCSFYPSASFSKISYGTSRKSARIIRHRLGCH